MIAERANDAKVLDQVFELSDLKPNEDGTYSVRIRPVAKRKQVKVGNPGQLIDIPVEKGRVEFLMLPDKGLDHHCCELHLDDNVLLLDSFMRQLNAQIAKYSMLQEAVIVDQVKQENGSVVCEVQMPKSKGNSKIAYAMYKKCLSQARKALV